MDQMADSSSTSPTHPSGMHSNGMSPQSALGMSAGGATYYSYPILNTHAVGEMPSAADLASAPAVCGPVKAMTSGGAPCGGTSRRQHGHDLDRGSSDFAGAGNSAASSTQDLQTAVGSVPVMSVGVTASARRGV